MIFSKKSLMTITILVVAIWVMPAISDDNVKELCINILEKFGYFKNDARDWSGTFISKTKYINNYCDYGFIEFVHYYFIKGDNQMFLTSATKRYINEITTKMEDSVLSKAHHKIQDTIDDTIGTDYSKAHHKIQAERNWENKLMNKLKKQIPKLIEEIKEWENLKTEIKNLIEETNKNLDKDEKWEINKKLDSVLNKINKKLDSVLNKINEKLDSVLSNSVLSKINDKLDSVLSKINDKLGSCLNSSCLNSSCLNRTDYSKINEKLDSVLSKINNILNIKKKSDSVLSIKKQIDATKMEELLELLKKQIDDMNVAEFTLNLMLSKYANDNVIEWKFSKLHGASEDDILASEYDILEFSRLQNIRGVISEGKLFGSDYIALALKNFALIYMKYLQTKLKTKTNKIENPMQKFCEEEINAKYDIIEFWNKLYFNFDTDLKDKNFMNSDIKA